MYRTERIEAKINMADYLEEYINVEEFLECCRVCPNYNKKWSCPPYDFNVEEYWKKYKEIEFFAIKIIFDEEVRAKKYTEEELKKIRKQSLTVEKKKLSEELYKKEQEQPGSISLSAGSCDLCGDFQMEGTGCCTRASFAATVTGASAGPELHCRHYDQLRYSIESLGGNVGKTCSKLLGLELEWEEEGMLPSHFVLVCALLLP